jgi:MazG family protein
MSLDNTLIQLVRLLKIMDRLREPGGCPWDAAQTPESLKPYLIEEAYEVLEAIDHGDQSALCEELGDLLLQVVFHARIGAERGVFDLATIAAGIADKLERRHPQIFNSVPPLDRDDHHRQWETIKREEKNAKGICHGPFDGIPTALPALQRTRKVLDRARRAGLPLPLVDLPREQWLQQMTAGLKSYVDESEETRAEILGELLIALLAKSDSDPEHALRLAQARYIKSCSSPT